MIDTFILLFLNTLLGYQEATFVYRHTTSNVSEYSTIRIEVQDREFKVYTEGSIYWCDKDFNTIKWQYKNSKDNIDIVAERIKNKIIISGKKANKDFRKVHEVSAKPWNQLVMDIGPLHALGENKNCFECYALRPDNFSINVLAGNYIKVETISVDNKKVKAIETKLSISNLPVLFWSASYWYREIDGVLVKVHTKRGPFAPLTVIELMEEKKSIR